MPKTDYRRELAELFTARTDPELIEVPTLRYLMIDGRGDPNMAGTYESALAALYAVSYRAKFLVRRAGGEDFRVLPLEGLWWANDPAAFRSGDRQDWQWTMMIMQPAPVSAELIEQARTEAAKKVPASVLSQLRFGPLSGRTAAQVLHIGPYSSEGPTIERLHAFIAAAGLLLAGPHQEVYLGDPRRTAAHRLRTILRQPVAQPPG